MAYIFYIRLDQSIIAECSFGIIKYISRFSFYFRLPWFSVLPRRDEDTQLSIFLLLSLDFKHWTMLNMVDYAWQNCLFSKEERDDRWISYMMARCKVQDIYYFS